MESEKVISIFDRLLEMINVSGGTSIVIGILSFLCLALCVLIVKRFFRIWQVEALKMSLYKDLISYYDTESGENTETTGQEPTGE